MQEHDVGKVILALTAITTLNAMSRKVLHLSTRLYGFTSILTYTLEHFLLLQIDE